jgi:DNA polymerase elongation subunit (family B)
VVLSFYNSILLRNTLGGKLLINTMHKTKLIERGIPQFSQFVTVNDFQEVGMFIVQPQSQTPKVLKHFIHALQEENPRVMIVVVNNDKDTPLASHRANPRGINNVHME